MNVWRIVAVVLLLPAGWLVWFAVPRFPEAKRLYQQDWVEPLAYRAELFQVDLTKPGQYEGQFDHRHTHAGAQLVFETPTAYPSWRDAEDALAGLMGTVSYVAPDGEVWGPVQLCDHRGNWYGAGGEGFYPAVDVGSIGVVPRATGVCSLRLTIEQGPAGWAEGKLPVVWRYRLCGCAKMRSLFEKALGRWSLVLAGVLVLAGGLCWWRGGRRKIVDDRQGETEAP